MWYFVLLGLYFFFFFNDTATTEIYTLSLHDALPIQQTASQAGVGPALRRRAGRLGQRCRCSVCRQAGIDRRPRGGQGAWAFGRREEKAARPDQKARARSAWHCAESQRSSAGQASR